VTTTNLSATVWMPNGAKPFGILRSVKAPGLPAGANVSSQTSTRALWKSVAYSREPFFVSAIARPLKIAPGTVTPTCASIEGGGGGTFAFQPLITPASEENRNSAGPLAMPECTTKPGPPL
jgi:hypothetical protein